MESNVPENCNNKCDDSSRSPEENINSGQEEHNQQYIHIIGTLPDDFPVQYIVGRNGQQEVPQFKIPLDENILSPIVLDEAKNISITSFESQLSVFGNSPTKSKDVSKCNMGNFYQYNKSFSNDCTESVDSSTKDFCDHSGSSYEEMSESINSEMECLKSEENAIDIDGKISPVDHHSQYEVVQVIKCQNCGCLFENKDNYKDHTCSSSIPSLDKELNCSKSEQVNLQNVALDENHQDLAKEDSSVCSSPPSSEASHQNHFEDLAQIYILGQIEESDCSPPEVNKSPVSEVTQKTPIPEDSKDINNESLIPIRRTKKILGCPKRGCRAKFSCSPNREIHVKCHSEDEGRSFQCHICSAPFNCWVKTQNHLWSIHHTDIEMLSCEFCGEYKTSTLHRMRNHTLTHLPQKLFKCEECSAEFSQSSQLINHQKTHSSNSNVSEKRVKRDTSVKKYSCEQCDYKCYNSNDLKKHILTHSSVSPLQCPKCDQRFRDASALRRHLLLIHIPLKLLNCPVCPYETSLPSKFSSHFTKSHQGRETVFVCKICNTEMESLSQYTNHSLTHRTDLLKQINNSTT